MHKELFRFQLPDYFATLFHTKWLIIYTYAFCIVLGIILGTLYTKWNARKTLGVELPNTFIYLIFSAGFIGGKIFYFIENPSYFWNHLSLLLNIFSGGFVFYGSFVTIIFVVIWYLKKHNIEVLPMLDILAITTIILQILGRTGCFFAGCCYGLPTNSAFGVVFPASNHLTVHPTQLYEVFILLLIVTFLLIINIHKQFQGQIFLLYISLYGICRIILEFFRGDTRGFIIKDTLSHSQFIATIILLIALLFYKKLKQKTI